MPYHLSKQAFADLVEAVLAQLPSQFAAALDEVAVEVLDAPTPRQRKQLMLRPDDVLLGLHSGRALIDRGVEDSGQLPDVIYIFQRPIEQMCQSEAQVAQEIRLTVLHELGHHFGLDEDELDRLGYG